MIICYCKVLKGTRGDRKALASDLEAENSFLSTAVYFLLENVFCFQKWIVTLVIVPIDTGTLTKLLLG